jgi:hypothetical protein
VTSPISYAAAEGYWIAAGGPADQAATAAAIAEAESSLIPDNTQKGQPYATTGWGLWQITPGDSEPQFGTDSALNDPLTNAKAAVAKYNGAGGNFSPWTTYEDGAYKQFLNSSTTPDTSGTSSSSGGGTTSSTSATVAQSVASECIIGIPNVDPASSIPLIGGLFPSTSVCIISKSQGRALLGGLMIGVAGLIGIVSVGVLLKAVTSGNTGVKHATGTVGDMFAGAARGRSPVTPGQVEQTPADALAGAGEPEAVTYRGGAPFKPETGRRRAQGGSAGRTVTDALNQPWSPPLTGGSRKSPGRKAGGRKPGSLFSLDKLATDVSLDDALALAVV